MNYWLVYQIYCKNTGKLYIGLTSKSLHERWITHTCMKNSNFAIHNAIHKYGKDAFILRTLKLKLTKKQAVYWEMYFIKIKNTTAPNGYNLTIGGEGVGGCKKTCQKISNKRILFFKNKNNRDHQRQIALDQWQNPEFIKKMKKGLKNRWENPETRINYLKGLQSKERKEKQKQIALKQWADPIFRKKMKQASINRWINYKENKKKKNEY